MAKFFKSLYLGIRFFFGIFLLAAGFLFSFWIPGLYPIIWVLSILFLLLFLFDCIALYKEKPARGMRKLPEKFSNSDKNQVEIHIENFSNIAIKKKDRVGLMTFSEKGGKMISPNSKASHLNILLEQLYNTETEFLDTDFGLLYAEIKRKITQRSLLMLYTNFEHISGLQRQLPFLKAIAKKHLLVVIFFENTELEAMVNTPADSIPQIFDQVVAEQLSFEKRLMVKELQKNGIQTILTPPEDLSINTINKYLEIKRRGIL